MDNKKIIQWLLEGDVSIQYQVYRDLLSTERQDLRKRIATEGFGAQFLSKRHKQSHWGKAFYHPKWTSSHYTLFDLRNLCISPGNEFIRESIDIILNTCKSEDGGVYPKSKKSDICINGMVLNYASYFKAEEEKLKSIVDILLQAIMVDGGFNCRSNRGKPVHSSLHTTLSVLEGITAYQYNGYTYRLEELRNAAQTSKEFILLHQLYISDRTEKIINKDFLRFSYPRRWRYDILSALDYFQYSNTIWDKRMHLAVDVLLKKRNKKGTWNLRAKYPGQTHFDMERAGQPSRWNTLRALRILKYYEIDIQSNNTLSIKQKIQND